MAKEFWPHGPTPIQRDECHRRVVGADGIIGDRRSPVLGRRAAAGELSCGRTFTRAKLSTPPRRCISRSCSLVVFALHHSSRLLRCPAANGRPPERPRTRTSDASSSRPAVIPPPAAGDARAHARERRNISVIYQRPRVASMAAPYEDVPRVIGRATGPGISPARRCPCLHAPAASLCFRGLNIARMALRPVVHAASV
ncbi:hypothetical protein MRX96_054972 [Rhipicephalus microplus]